ncbi:MAG: FkbM family methyltransferase [Pseudomonadota bacterium]
MTPRVARILRRLGAGAPVQSVEMRLVHAQIGGRAVNFCINRPRDVIQRQHVKGQFYEAPELADLAAVFPAGGTFVDIGANIGNHTLWAALFMGASKVIAFEPNPKAIDVLVPNVAVNGLTGIVDLSHLGVGLGAAASEGFGVQRAPGNLGAAQLEEGTGALTVERADVLLKGIAPDMIKIDVEGMEIDVLAGLSGVLERCQPILFVEVDTHNAEAFSAWLNSSGYATAKSYKRYAENENHLVAPTAALASVTAALATGVPA